MPRRAAFMNRTKWLFLAVILVVIALVAVGLAISGIFSPPESKLILATTTSTQNSGLLDFILPDFKSMYGVKVDVVAVGSGLALDYARRGDADVVLSHSPSLEAPFMEQGYGLFKWQVMYNQFAIVGPSSDPAGVATAWNATAAFEKVADNSSTSRFLSRSDNSGTYAKELQIWGLAGLDPDQFGSWYLKVGKGMEDTLIMANGMGDAYTLTDEGTYFSMIQALDLVELFRNDTLFFNQYSVIPANPAKNLNVNVKYAVIFAEWIVSPEMQDLIASHTANGHQLFFPNAEP
jgi:tungstate transport system substrate-binding protein